MAGPRDNVFDLKVVNGTKTSEGQGEATDAAEEAAEIRKGVADALRAQADAIEEEGSSVPSGITVLCFDGGDVHDLRVEVFGVASYVEIIGLIEMAKNSLLGGSGGA